MISINSAMEIFFVFSKIRAVQIRAMENRASRGMPVLGKLCNLTRKKMFSEKMN